MRIELSKDQWVTLQGDCQGVRIICRSGVLWLTQAGDRRDYLLEPAGEFVVRSNAMVFVEARRPAILDVAAPTADVGPPGVLRRVARLFL